MAERARKNQAPLALRAARWPTSRAEQEDERCAHSSSRARGASRSAWARRWPRRAARARAVFEEVDEALGQKLSRLMAEGPLEELTLTENAQPAIMANAIATLRASGIDLDAKADFVAGHSLGEYSALCAAGAFDLADHRAAAEAARPGDAGGGAGGARARWRPCSAPTSRSPQAVAEAAAQGEVCTVANDNDPGAGRDLRPQGARSSGRSRSPRRRARSARSCCRSRRRSTAR